MKASKKAKTQSPHVCGYDSEVLRGSVSEQGMRSYQKSKTQELGHSLNRRLLILRYGAGKTWVMLAAAHIKHRLLCSTQSIEAIVLCRNRNVDTWKAEIQKRHSSPDARCVTDEDFFNRPFTFNTIVLCPHHLVEKHTALLNNVITTLRPVSLICDESTKIKNLKTDRTKACLALADFHRAAVSGSSQFCMTGRATPEGPWEILTQLAFCNQAKRIGGTYYGMLKRFFLVSDRGPALIHAKRQEFYDLCAAAISRLDEAQWIEFMKEDTVEPQYVTEYYQETVEQDELIHQLESQWQLDHDGGSDEYNWTIQLHAKAQQIANGFFRTQEGKTVWLNAGKESNKLTLLIDIVQDLLTEKPDRKLIIWCHYEEDYKLIGNALGMSDINFAVGPDTAQIQRFQHMKCSVILMPVTVSEGFNELAIADTAIFFSNVYSIETRTQAEHRMIRLNQTSKIVTFIDLCGRHSYDRRIVESLQTKRPL